LSRALFTRAVLVLEWKLLREQTGVGLHELEGKWSSDYRFCEKQRINRTVVRFLSRMRRIGMNYAKFLYILE
jgi:hypothetical protein